MSAHIMEAIQFLLTFGEFFLCFLYLELFINGSKISKRNLRRVILPCAGLALIVSCNRNIVFFSFLMLMIQTSVLFLIAKFIYKKKSIWLFSIVCFYNIQVALLDLAITFLITKNRTEKEYINYYMNHLTKLRLSGFLLCRALLSVSFYFLLIKIRKRDKEFNIFPYTNVLFSVSISEVVAMYYFMSIFTAFRNFTYISSWFGLLAIGITACCLLGFYIKLCLDRQRMQIIEIRNAMLEKSYQEMYKASMDSSMEYHDFKNQMGIIYDYIKEGKNQKAMSYIEKIRRPVLLLQEYTQTGNRALDLVLSDKLRYANDCGIKVTARLDRIGSTDIDDFDLYSIMANILDNAIEACNLINYGERWLDIILTRKNQIIFIEVKNNFQVTPIRVNDSLKSTKENKKGHGYGLQSVQVTTEKYNGYLETRYDKTTFDISITLFADKKQQIDGQTYK